MKKSMLFCALAMVLTLLLAGCGCKHEWYAATCAAPKTCSLCGKTEGETLPHTWADATCSAPKTCTVCKATEGETLPHTWAEATCAAPKTCTVCAATEGEPLPHTWADVTCTTPKTCTVCQTTEGEPLPHTWQDATCTDQKICTVCQTTEGEPLGHTWQEATCTTLKTCTVCQFTEGELVPHTWLDATCTTPKTCSVCQATEGETADHKWLAATTEAPKTCSVCQKTSGSKLNTDPRFTTKSTKALQGTWYCDVVFSDEMLGMENFGGVDGRITMKFGNTGELTTVMLPKDKKAFMERYEDYTVNLMYDTFAQKGMSKEEANQAMLATYGLNVEDYVEAYLKQYEVEDLFASYNYKEVYYVEGDTVFTAISWKAAFTSNTFTITNGKLVIDGLTLEDGGESLVWKRA